MGNELPNLSPAKKTNKNNNQVIRICDLQQIIRREDGIIFSSTYTPIKYFILKTHTTIDRSIHKLLLSNCQKMKGERFNSLTNIVKMQVTSQSQFCSKQYTLKALFQYFDHTLKQEINQRKDNPYSHFTVTDILSLYRFVIDLFKQHRQAKLPLPILGLDSIKILKQQSRFKFINPLVREFDQHFTIQELFFGPQNFGLQYKESQIVFSFGMLLLSVSLLDDCSDCYDMKNSNFCWSVLEDKLMRLSELQFTCSFDASSLHGIDLTSFSNMKNMSKMQKNVGMRSSGQLIEAIYWMLQRNPQQRPSIDQSINLYRTILKNLRQSKPQKECQPMHDRCNTSLNNILKHVIFTQNQQEEELQIKTSRVSIQNKGYKIKNLEALKNSRNKENHINPLGMTILRGKQSNYLF